MSLLLWQQVYDLFILTLQLPFLFGIFRLLIVQYWLLVLVHRYLLLLRSHCFHLYKWFKNMKHAIVKANKVFYWILTRARGLLVLLGILVIIAFGVSGVSIRRWYRIFSVTSFAYPNKLWQNHIHVTETCCCQLCRPTKKVRMAYDNTQLPL